MSRDRFIADALAADTDDCIIWPYAVRQSNGYGAYSTREPGVKRNWDVHRYTCEKAHGKPPEGHEAAHECGQKLCINRKHLYWATPKKNSQDSIEHGVLRGGGKYRQRIFDKEREDIVKSKDSVLVLAKKYQITPTYVSKIRKREKENV